MRRGRFAKCADGDLLLGEPVITRPRQSSAFRTAIALRAPSPSHVRHQMLLVTGTNVEVTGVSRVTIGPPPFEPDALRSGLEKILGIPQRNRRFTCRRRSPKCGRCKGMDTVESTTGKKGS